MNIAIDIRNIGKGRTGSEVVVLQLVKHLLRKDQDNKYFLLTDTEDRGVLTYVERALELDGKKNVKIVSLSSPHRLVWLVFSLPFFIRKNRINVFHTEYIVPFCIPSNVLVLTHVHDVSFANPQIRPLIGSKDLFILDILMARSLRRANHVIVVSEFTRKQVEKYYGYGAPKVRMIYNALGYDNDDAGIAKDKAAEVRSKYSLPLHYIFAIGTMQPRKNIPFLIKSFAHTASKIPEVDLVLSGPRGKNFDKVIEATLRKYPDISSRVHFTGYIDQDDLRCVYSEALCTAHPSLYEGFGLPLLESFWADVPVIASDIPVYREIARDAALYFDKCEIDHCSEVLYTVCTDKSVRKRLLEQGRNERMRFSWEKSTDLFLQLYRDNPRR